MSELRVVIVGGGAAGFFAAITCAETFPKATVNLLEKGPKFLSKVRISGGGRCNVTHACFEPRELTLRYPRGSKALVAPYHAFQARDTVEWFAARGVELKTEADGRMFPVTDSSETIIECLMNAAASAGVRLVSGSSVEQVERQAGGGFKLTNQKGESLLCDRLMLATGGCRSASAGQLAIALGHSIEPPVPSLFTFHVEAPWLRALAGISIPSAEVSVLSSRLRESGPMLITHAGLSGPAILRLSAWGARELHDANYRFPLLVNWLPELNAEALGHHLDSRRNTQPARLVVNTPVAPLAARLWEALVLFSGISRETRWSQLTRSARHNLIQALSRTELPVIGKTLNQDEFVTCGGVCLSEVNFKTMESRLCPGLYFGGELLDIDGITGGFNFQSAWTTGWLAGKAMGKAGS